MTKLPTHIFFLIKHTATTEIYTLSLHDALPISGGNRRWKGVAGRHPAGGSQARRWGRSSGSLSCRSEEHTSELQSRFDLVCRLLLEKKNHTSGENWNSDYRR